jgi:hypothetical protein
MLCLLFHRRGLAMLVERVLKRISDTRSVTDHKPGQLPVDALVEAYNQKAIHVDELPNIKPESTGRELKDAIELMEPEDQVEMLHVYLLHSGEVSEPKAPVESEEVEKRHLNIWFAKGLFLLVCAVVLLICGAMIVLAVREGHANNAAFAGLLETAKEILDILVGDG